MSDCVFCDIAAGTIPSDVVATNDEAVAFRDLAPVAPTHVLVIPRRHIENAGDLAEGDAGLLSAMLAMAIQVAGSEGVARGGYRLVFNVGEDAGNTVPHLHLHVIGGRTMAWPPG